MDFQFLGGASEVGRLGMILKKGPISLLFDYGLLPRDPPQYPMPAPPVDGMFISHAHLDHTGMIPWVTRRQDLDVVLTPPTADVADLLLQDSLKIADAEGFDAPFDDRDLRTARRRFRTIDFGDNVDTGDLEVTAHPAGHIPGATMYEVNGTETTLFTGDLHTLTTDLVCGARSVEELRQEMHRVEVVRNPRESGLALRGEVIVTASGMLGGGPVLRYLEAIREDPRSAVLLTGYQVEGPKGRRLIDEGVIDLYGVTVDIKCEWQKFDFSAHAGHDDLLRFIEGCDPQRVVLMHGENRQILADAIEGREVLLPEEGKWYSV